MRDNEMEETMNTVSGTTCPHCQSQDTQKVSLVYESGTFRGDAVGLGTDFRGAVGVAGGVTSHSSLLAKRLAPPVDPRKGIIPLLILLCMCSIFGLVIAVESFAYSVKRGMICLGLVVGIVSLTIIVMHYQKKKDYPHQRQQWERLWICLKCGHTWTPGTETERKVLGRYLIV